MGFVVSEAGIKVVCFVLWLSFIACVVDIEVKLGHSLFFANKLSPLSISKVVSCRIGTPKTYLAED